MAQVITRGFRLVSVQDLSDLAKTLVSMEQVTEISHDGGQETEGRRYEDSIVDNLTFRKGLSGNITIKGDIEVYCYPSYTLTVKTDQLFELDHYYLIRCLGLDVNNASKMVYRRWIGQLVDRPKESLKSGEIAEREIVLKLAIFGTKSYAADTPYIATADATPGPADATPTADYDPLFSAVVDDSTKDLDSAETEVGSIVNPW